MLVGYTLDASGRVTAVDKTVDTVIENLVTGVVYEPFGPVSNFTYGNGLTMSATFDQDFELDQLQSGTGLNWIFGYDDTGNILTIDDQVIPANDQTFAYDDLYRLDTAAGTYLYDGRGQRVSKTADGVTTHFIYGLSGELLGEFYPSSTELKEYIYLNGQPVAVSQHTTQVVQPPPVEVIFDNDDPGTSWQGQWVVKTDAQSYGGTF